MRRAFLALTATLASVLVVTGCAGSGEPTIETDGAVVVDVRTPAEYASGHLEGAVNLDVEDQAAFAASLTTLDPDDPYVVYCRSGNRSAAAAGQMSAAGFTDVTDAGGLQAASDATGLPVVTD